MGSFIDMTTVLLLLGMVGKCNRLFRVAGTNPRPFRRPRNLRYGKSAASFLTHRIFRLVDANFSAWRIEWNSGLINRSFSVRDQ